MTTSDALLESALWEQAQSWAARGVGVLAAALLVAALLVVVLSLPVSVAMALRVLVAREWVPVTYNLRSLKKRIVSTLATVGGLTLVVFVLSAVLMFAGGIERTLESAGAEHQAKVMRKNVPGEGASYLSPDQLQVLATAPGIVRRADGSPLASAELVTLIWVARAGSDDPDDGANLTIRGFLEEGLDLHPPVGLEGRMFRPSTNELVVGSAIAGRYEGAHLGGTLRVAGTDWEVVGVVDHGGNAFDSEVWGSFEAIAPVIRRGFSSAAVALEADVTLDDFNQWMAGQKLLEPLEATWTRDFWRSRSGNYVEFVMILGLVVAVIFSFGAVLGAMNTMYTQVAARTREIGTLRAIGFKPRAILTSLVLESVVLSAIAGGLGVALAATLERVEFRLTSVATLSEIAYDFHLSPAIVVAGLGFSLAMGYAGGLLPAWRAARMPIVNAVRAD